MRSFGQLTCKSLLSDRLRFSENSRGGLNSEIYISGLTDVESPLHSTSLAIDAWTFNIGSQITVSLYGQHIICDQRDDHVGWTRDCNTYLCCILGHSAHKLMEESRIKDIVQGSERCAWTWSGSWAAATSRSGLAVTRNCVHLQHQPNLTWATAQTLQGPEFGRAHYLPRNVSHAGSGALTTVTDTWAVFNTLHFFTAQIFQMWCGKPYTAVWKPSMKSAVACWYAKCCAAPFQRCWGQLRYQWLTGRACQVCCKVKFYSWSPAIIISKLKQLCVIQQRSWHISKITQKTLKDKIKQITGHLQGRIYAPISKKRKERSLIWHNPTHQIFWCWGGHNNVLSRESTKRRRLRCFTSDQQT